MPTFLSGAALENSTPTRRGRPPIGNRVIRVGGAIALPSVLREHGIDAAALIAQVGLPVVAFDHPDNAIPFAKLGELGHLAAGRTGLSDILDPSLCPHTGTPMPGGLSFNQASVLLERLARSGRRVIGFDLNEVSPGIKPIATEPESDANVGARVLSKSCGMAAFANGLIKP